MFDLPSIPRNPLARPLPRAKPRRNWNAKCPNSPIYLLRNLTPLCGVPRIFPSRLQPRERELQQFQSQSSASFVLIATRSARPNYAVANNGIAPTRRLLRSLQVGTAPRNSPFYLPRAATVLGCCWTAVLSRPARNLNKTAANLAFRARARAPVYMDLLRAAAPV